MEVELTVFERLVLQNVLPREANFVTLGLMRVFKEALSFSEEENKKFKFVQESDRLTWNQEAAKGVVKTVEVGETMENLIVKTLKEMDSKSTLTADHITLFEKFVEKQATTGKESLDD